MPTNFVVWVKNVPELSKVKKCPWTFEKGSKILLPLVMNEDC